MPLIDLRTAVIARAKRNGKRTVRYFNAGKRSVSATVLGPGTVSGLKLQLDDVMGSGGIVDNVPACTAMSGAGSTSCYRARSY